MPYEIQHNTLCDGWVNTWFVTDHHGDLHPETFEAASEAEAALDEYLFDLQEEHYAGQIEAYDPEDFRIRWVEYTEAQVNNLLTGVSP